MTPVTDSTKLQCFSERVRDDAHLSEHIAGHARFGGLGPRPDDIGNTRATATRAETPPIQRPIMGLRLRVGKAFEMRQAEAVRGPERTSCRRQARAHGFRGLEVVAVQGGADADRALSGGRGGGVGGACSRSRALTLLRVRQEDPGMTYG